MIIGNRMEVVNGLKRAVFLHNEHGWRPDWFYEGPRRLLRFVDHAWLAVGAARPAYAQQAQWLDDGGAVFAGLAEHGDTPFVWSVRVRADEERDGFLIEASFTPADRLGAIPAGLSLETEAELLSPADGPVGADLRAMADPGLYLAAAGAGLVGRAAGVDRRRFEARLRLPVHETLAANVEQRIVGWVDYGGLAVDADQDAIARRLKARAADRAHADGRTTGTDGGRADDVRWMAACWTAAAAACAMSPGASDAKPIALHPANPHYFVYNGKPTVLVTSGEHYGAVLNLDFDYVRYLDELKSNGLNATRLFSGTYREVPGSFGISGNTLAPEPGRYLAPWARSETPGYDQGGAKFDLNKWDPAYFKRLKDFVAQARRRGIVVELSLFCPFYDEGLWKANPMNAINNVNGVGSIPSGEVYTLKHPEMVAVHEAFVRKVVAEMRDADNLYYEIANEPYFGGITPEWQRHIADVIVETEKGFAGKHLIAQNIANESAKVVDPHPAVSILNFHYASPPKAVEENYGLNRVIGFDETGFKGTEDSTYRRQAWEFLLAGGAEFSNLDYSFTASNPDGTYHYPDTQPGGGSRALRQQLNVLLRFMQALDFVHMRPAAGALHGLEAGAHGYVLANEGKQYAAYAQLRLAADAWLAAQDGEYEVTWIDPLTGETVKSERASAAAGRLPLTPPADGEEWALRATRR